MENDSKGRISISTILGVAALAVSGMYFWNKYKGKKTQSKPAVEAAVTAATEQPVPATVPTPVSTIAVGEPLQQGNIGNVPIDAGIAAGSPAQGSIWNSENNPLTGKLEQIEASFA